MHEAATDRGAAGRFRRRPVSPTTALLYLAGSFAVGLGVGVAGPSLGMLKEQVGVGTGAIGLVFSAQGCGYLLGSQLLARGYDRGWGHRLQGCGQLGVAAAFLLVPFAPSLTTLMLAFVAVGLAMGTNDVGSNTHIVWIFGDRVGSWMASLHLCFGVGALCSPLLARLSEAVFGDVTLAFGVPAVMIAVVGLGVLTGQGPQPPAHVRAPRTAEVRQSRRPPGLLALIGFAFLYVGIEVGVSSWLDTFGREIGHSKGQAAALNSLFWLTFTAGRLANVAIARNALRFRPLLIAAGGASLGMVLLTTLSRSLSWPAIVLFGIAVGPQFPLLVTIVGRRVQLSGTSMAWFMGAAGLGSLTWPWVIGRLIDGWGPRAMPLAALTLQVLALSLLLGGTFGLRRHHANQSAGSVPPPAEIVLA